MPYRFEIFLSYPRTTLVTQWLDHFLPLFGGWLTEELLAHKYELKDRKVGIFRDDQIEAGQKWPNVLRDAARDSRCALAILLPSYEASPHCRAEWDTFRKRGPELIVPVRFHDCENRPEQIFDLSAFTSTMKGSSNWPDFNDKIKRLASDTAKRVMNAPRYPRDLKSCRNWVALRIPRPPAKRRILQARL